MRILRSIGSVLGSYILCVLLVYLSDAPLKAMFPHEFVDLNTAPSWLLWVSTALFFVISVFCAWVCAKTAPDRVVKHVMWFFALGEVMGAGSMYASYGKAPLWFSIAWLVAWIPAVFIGWKVARR